MSSKEAVEFKVGCLGQWAEEPTWATKLKKEVVSSLTSHTVPTSRFGKDESVVIEFQRSISPSQSKQFPDGVVGATHLQRTQELMLARQVDIVVLVLPNGLGGDAVERHLDVLEQVSKCLVVWLPQATDEDRVTEEDMSKPGVFPVTGGIKTLTRTLLYLVGVEYLGHIKTNVQLLRHSHIPTTEESTETAPPTKEYKEEAAPKAAPTLPEAFEESSPGNKSSDAMSLTKHG